MFAFRLRAACAAGLLLLAGCQRLSPLQPGEPEGTPPPAPTSAPASADKSWCPDFDRDNWSQSSGCNIPDCNETLHFADPDTGWCAQASDLICDPPDDVLAGDFALLREDGLLHVFYIEGPLWTWYPATHGKSFGHQTSADGVSWQTLDDALTVNPASDWDRDHVWAPGIVFNPDDGLYWMFYTGVIRSPVSGWHEERIGAATSSDLVTWTRVTAGGCDGIVGPGCLLDADWDWTSWDDPGYWSRQCRDPFVMADPITGLWYMVYTTAPGPFDWTGVVAMARSEDLVHWTDQGPLSVTRGQKAESPCLFLREGRLHLMWTLGDDGGIGHSTAGGFETGDWTEPTIVPGSVAGLQVAPEILDMGSWVMLGYVKETLRDLRFRMLRFHDDGTLEEQPIAPLDCPWVGAENVHPGAGEVANGVDDNCNGLVDEPAGPCPDADGDLYGSPGSAFCSRLKRDCDDQDPSVHPDALEICGNGRDDNCDGVVDDPEQCRPRFNNRYIAIY